MDKSVMASYSLVNQQSVQGRRGGSMKARKEREEESADET